jgi:hypothetical protein
MSPCTIGATVTLIAVAILIVLWMRHERKPTLAGPVPMPAVAENPGLGAVNNIRSIVDGRNWTIRWDPPSDKTIATDSYQFNLIGPQPDTISSLYGQIVRGTQFQVPDWLYEGTYQFTIWPYDARHGKGIARSTTMNNTP